MKKLLVLLTVGAAIAFSTTCYAPSNITSAWWGSDGDGVIVCPVPGWTNNAVGPVSSLWMSGDQYAIRTPDHGTPGPATGHMNGGILTDSAGDPTLYLSGTIKNDTGLPWYGYTINVIMSSSFTFSPISPQVDNPPNSDGWFLAGLGAPTLQPSGPYAGMWLGDIIFSKGAGSVIDVNQDLWFEYAVTFSGGLNFSFTQEMIPAFGYIPEPSTFVLAGVGGLLLVFRLRRHRRPAA